MENKKFKIKNILDLESLVLRNLEKLLCSKNKQIRSKATKALIEYCKIFEKDITEETLRGESSKTKIILQEEK